MTRQLDLRTGRPVWEAYPVPAIVTEPLRGDVAADVLVVGLGVSGAMIAEAATDAGYSVIAIDRRGPLLGSTSATTALVQYEIDQPLTVLTKKIGAAKAERAWRRSRLAVDNLQSRIADLGIDCDLTPRPSLYVAGDVLDASGLVEEAAARRLSGLYSNYLTRDELVARFGIERDAAVLSHNNLALDPRKLTAGMALAAQARGARFYSPVEATTFEPGKSLVEVGTADGPKISARYVVLATGFELVSIVPRTDHRIISTWAMATRPQPENLWSEQCFMWEASDPYLYLRATADGRVICGGEDEEFSDEDQRDALIEGKTAAIAAKLERLLPRLDVTPEFAWTGSFGTTDTGLPIIGRLPRHERIFALMGYGGNGITYSRIAAEILVAAMAVEKDRDADLYALG